MVIKCSALAAEDGSNHASIIALVWYIVLLYVGVSPYVIAWLYWIADGMILDDLSFWVSSSMTGYMASIFWSNSNRIGS